MVMITKTLTCMEFFTHRTDFKSGYLQASFENVNIYLLMAHILKIKPERNDGNYTSVKDMLKNLDS